METIPALLQEVEDCSRCKKMKPCTKMPMRSHGRSKSRVMLIQYHPDKASVKKEKYFYHTAGDKIRKVFKKMEVHPKKQIYTTDLVKCLPEGEIPKEVVSNCFGFIEKEIELIQPKLILTIGKNPTIHIMKKFDLEFKSMLQLHNENGFTQLKAGDITIIPLLHPSEARKFMDFVLYHYQLKDVMEIVKELGE